MNEYNLPRFYVGDGISGFRRWVYARVLWGRLRRFGVDWFDPGLPDGYSWCVRVDDRGLYARKYR